MKMKILHIGKYYPPFQGGMENFLDDLAQQQAVLGHDIRVLCHWHETGRLTRTEKLSAALKVTRAKIKGVLGYAPVAPDFFKTLRAILLSFAPDVIHVHLPNVSAFFLLFLKNLPKIVVHWHSDVVASDYDIKLRLLYPGYRIFEKKLLSMAQTIIATSDVYLQSSIPLMHVKQKCRVVPLGISIGKMEAMKNDVKLTLDSQAIGNKTALMNRHFMDCQDFILAVGRFSYYKGFEYLIRACAHGFDKHVVIVGDGPLKPSLEKLIRQHLPGKRIFMPGILPDTQLSRLLSRCTAFCLPSVERTEAFGLVLLEAMYYGKPLITTHVIGSGMNEVNIHNETGLVVAPENPSQLAQAMNVMVYNKELSRAMGRKGRERLLEKFDIAEVADSIEKLY